MSFKDNMKDLMDYKDITLKELSFLTGNPKGSLSNYLKENCSIPSADIAVKIAKALNVSVEYLVTGSNATSLKQSSYTKYPLEILDIAEKLSKFTKEKQLLVRNLINDLEKI